MTDETATKTTMKPEEAIVGTYSLQIKHNQEIKQLQEDFKKIEETIANSIGETNTKMKDEFIIVNDKLASHIMSTTAQIDTGLNNIKEEMAGVIGEHIQKLYDETKTIKEQNTVTIDILLKQMQEINHNLNDIKTARQNDEQSQQLDNNQNVISFPSPPTQIRQERTSSSPITNNDASIHTNSSELNNNRMQTILLPPPTTAPVFHGKPTERPWQFLIRVEEYTETVHMWGEDMLLRGISQFLKDTALEWYCQLRSCHYLPRTWAEFKQTFIAQFNSPIRIAQQQQQWNECRQNKDETINEFIIRLRALWVEQFPQETEADLIKHLFCKMRPDMLNIMGCPRNAPLQEILLEAQRVEEILYYRSKQNNQVNKSASNGGYVNDSLFNRNITSTNRNNEHIQAYDQTYNNTTNSIPYQQMQRNQTDQQQISCYHCHRFGHRTRDCWYNKQHNNNYSQQSTSFSKNE